MMLFLFVFLPVLSSFFTFLVKSIYKNILILLTTSAITFIYSVIVLLTTASERIDRFGYDFFVSDTSSRLFLGLISAGFFGISLYVSHRVFKSPWSAKGIHRFVRGALLFFAFSSAAILSDHLILMCLLLELTTLAIAPLIYHQKGQTSVVAAWRYFLFSSVGLGMVFFGFALLSFGAQTVMHGSENELSFFMKDLLSAQMMEIPSLWSGLGLGSIIFGYGTKLGLAPLYTWLPEAYDLSPPSVTALLAAVQFNVAILALFRVFQCFHPLELALIRYEFIFMGLATMILSSIHIVVEKNYKRLIAYASMNHVGVMAVGLGMGSDAAYGVVLYAVSNALVKAILFLTCGNIKARYGTKDLTKLQGLIQNMPFSGLSFMIGIFALLGFAPFGSFIGEVMIMKSMIFNHQYTVFTLFCFLTTVTFIAMGRSLFPMIWGDSKQEVGLKGESMFTLMPNLFFVGILVLLGLYIPEKFDDLLLIIGHGIGGR